MGKLILVRHGETNKNLAKSIHSKGDSEGLNDKGRGQIEMAAQRLSQMNVGKVFHSTEKRAIESAQIISSVLKLNAEKLTGFEERNWGDLAGKSWEDIKKILDPMTLDERFNYVPPKGESWKKFEERLTNAVNEITTKNPEDVIVVVTHGGAIRALMPVLLKVPREESFKYDPDNASLTIFDFVENSFANTLLNDTSHLK